MRIGLAADFHLDKRLGHRIDPTTGANPRALDLERAVGRIIDGFIRERVDVACVLGDLFDIAKPSERARQTLIREIRRLQEALPECRIVLLRGNHDAPSSFVGGTAVGTAGLALPGVETVDAFERRVIEIGDLALTAIPWMRSDDEFVATIAEAKPLPGKQNLLLLHCGLADLAEFAEHRPGSQTLTRPIVPEGFDWIFSGHFHGHRTIEDLRFTFVGSSERLSVSEAKQPKGFLVWETEQRAFTFHPITTRSWYDLGSIDGSAMSAADLVTHLETLAAGIPDWREALVRIRVLDLSVETYAALDMTRINRLRASAFHGDIELRRRDELDVTSPDGTSSDEGPILLDLPSEWRRHIERRDDLAIAERESLTTRGLGALGG